MDIQATIKSHVESNPVVLYMKGSPKFPQCGFSALAVEVLKKHLGNDEQAFVTVNVLEDPDIRQGIKEYSSWPTIPQLYVKGEFIGGADIIKELHESGELANILKGKSSS